MEVTENRKRFAVKKIIFGAEKSFIERVLTFLKIMHFSRINICFFTGTFRNEKNKMSKVIIDNGLYKKHQ